MVVSCLVDHDVRESLKRMKEREMKTTLTLSFPHNRFNATTAEEAREEMYRVEKITNSLHFKPAELLSKAQVSDAIQLSMFDVTIVPVKRS